MDQAPACRMNNAEYDELKVISNLNYLLLATLVGYGYLGYVSE